MVRRAGYSPELDDVERLLRTNKHHELPERTHLTPDRLHDAVAAASARREAALASKRSNRGKLVCAARARGAVVEARAVAEGLAPWSVR